MATALETAFERQDICNWNFKRTLSPYFRRWSSEDFKTGRFGSIIADIGKEQSPESKSGRSRSRSRSRERKKPQNNKVCLVIQYFLFSINRGLLFYFILFLLALSILFILFNFNLLALAIFFILFYSILLDFSLFYAISILLSKHRSFMHEYAIFIFIFKISICKMRFYMRICDLF